ncbi:MAG: aminotransferase class III-fold pyridoxal phosphate-dependent enzyme [Candidatus Lokiarchaeota archaeon]|nr:aminotransferase class III-fold pyridoxal phosphate-dependent enzyme [Candidatus Lokiarchaeota archaeon]
MFLKNELDQYYTNRPKSKDIWEKAVKVLPGGISHNIRTFGLPSIGAFPLFIKSGNGSHITDVDNNEYLDCWLGHFTMILGHNHPKVQEILKENISLGWHFGTNTEYQVNLAELIIKKNPGIEMMRFCTSGTEATMYATRLSRAFTKRKLVAKAILGWHGANDTLYYGVGNFNKETHPPGLRSEEEAGIKTFEVNNEQTFDMIKKNKKTLAAIILEPILGGGGGFRANLDFLKRLREETEKNDILLIFDEVITGYRFRNSLFQNELKIIPDLTTMGKIIGGGLPIGAIGGRKDIIERSSPQEENQILIGGGTFSGYPLSMIAGLKTLEILKDSQQQYERINHIGNRLLKSLNQFFTDNRLPFITRGYKSVVMIHVLSNFIENPTMRQIVGNSDKKGEALLHLALFNRNVVGLHGLGSISMAHTDEDIAQIKAVVEEIAQPVSDASKDL